jgi:hypothetical protein
MRVFHRSVQGHLRGVAVPGAFVLSLVACSSGRRFDASADASVSADAGAAAPVAQATPITPSAPVAQHLGVRARATLDLLAATPARDRLDPALHLAKSATGLRVDAVIAMKTARGGRFSPLSADRFEATLPLRSSAPLHLAERDGGMESGWLDLISDDLRTAAGVEADVGEGTAVFADALPGIDEVHVGGVGRTEQLRVVHAPTGDGRSLTMTTRARLGGRIADVRARAGAFEALDRQGNARIVSQRVVAWDASGRELPVRISTRREGDELLLVIEATTAGARFPVVIDPTWQLTFNNPSVDHTSGAVAYPFGPTTAGTVMVIGGGNTPEQFSPYAGTAGLWSPLPALSANIYSGWSSVRLPTGQVLFAGVTDASAGKSAPNYPTTSWVYDVAGNTLARAGDMQAPHDSPALVVLPTNNKIFAYGSAHGSSYNGASIELFDLGTRTWATEGTQSFALNSFVAARYVVGTSEYVAIIGGGGYGAGFNPTPYSFDPTTGVSTPMTNAPVKSRESAVPVTLADGSVLMVGGTELLAGGGNQYASTAEIFAAGTTALNGTFTATANNMGYARQGHAITPLPNGTFLVTGGAGLVAGSGAIAGTLSTTEIFDPTTRKFSPGPSMVYPRQGHAAIGLVDGRVLIIGGANGGASNYNAEIFTPDPVMSGSGSGCPSGVAADGYCCDRACAGTCEACNLAGHLGICTPVNGSPPSGHSGSCGQYLCGGYSSTAGAGACLTSCTADTACVSGDYCDTGTGTCVPLKSNGSGCARGGECSSTFCVDGYCCNGACNGSTCEACDVAGKAGICSAVNTGNPHGTHGSCGNFACVSGACYSGTCTLDTECASNYYCDTSSGSCVASIAKGSVCTKDAQCNTGHCVDGYCCDTACNGACQACDVSPGTCSGITGSPHGTRSCAPYAFCSSGLCNASCVVNADCTTGDCDPSTGKCVMPVVDAGPDVVDMGTPDTGTPDTGATDTGTPDTGSPDTGSPDTGAPDTGVTEAAAEVGGDDALPIAMQPAPMLAGTPSVKGIALCAKDSECSTGHCVEGVCCDTACDTKCFSCALLSSPGKCTPEPIGVDLKNECGAAASCLATCGGSGQCVGAGDGTMCARNRCTGPSTGIGAAYCKMHGTPCDENAGVEFDCSPYACAPAFGACLTACATTEDCANGFTCDTDAKTCVAAPATKGGGCSLGAPRSNASSSGVGFGAALAVIAAIGARRRRSRRERTVAPSVAS